MKIWILSKDLRADAICWLTTNSRSSEGGAEGLEARYFLVSLTAISIAVASSVSSMERSSMPRSRLSSFFSSPSLSFFFFFFFFSFSSETFSFLSFFFFFCADQRNCLIDVLYDAYYSYLFLFLIIFRRVFILTLLFLLPLIRIIILLFRLFLLITFPILLCLLILNAILSIW